MLDLVEGTEQEVIKAAEAERLVGEQLQQLGQETLQAWAEERHDRQVSYWERRQGVNRKEKKTLLVHALGTSRASGTTLPAGTGWGLSCSRLRPRRRSSVAAIGSHCSVCW